MIANKIMALFEARPQSYSSSDRDLLAEFLQLLNAGNIRAAEQTETGWKVNQWVKMGILSAFRMGVLVELPWSDKKPFFDKDTIREKTFSLDDQVRIVPGGSSARNGCYLAPGVTVMPPAFINIGAWIGSGTMVDSHALVGSCAQVGAQVHLSAGAMLGGVLEPIGSRPVIIEDNVFIGGNTGIYEGVIVSSQAVVAAGTVITSSTPIFDAVHGSFLPKDAGNSYTIPSGAVLVPGSRTLKNHPGFQINCPVIIKYRDANTDVSVALESDLRSVLE